MPATAAQPTGESSALTPEVRRAALALIIGGIAAILDTTIVTIALHTLVIKLHSTVGTIQWVSTAYLLALAARARGQIGPRYLPSSPGASSDVVSLALPGGVGALML